MEKPPAFAPRTLLTTSTASSAAQQTICSMLTKPLLRRNSASYRVLSNRICPRQYSVRNSVAAAPSGTAPFFRRSSTAITARKMTAAHMLWKQKVAKRHSKAPDTALYTGEAQGRACRAASMAFSSWSVRI